ncbi:YALIA101S07e05974g1_1 [Yarrowia lipolytica]|nr:Pre-mRNA-splicing factor SYF1 [Yarrowia lipolytica]SEI35638.1 YALIA101S07e05974g1_1 [Yarrowia lipolytica]
MSQHELDIASSPGDVRPWIRYISSVKNDKTTARQKCILFERAVTALPRSYKLWKEYLDFRSGLCTGLNPIKHADEYDRVNALYEKSLVLLHKMPVIWLQYLQFLMLQPKVTKTRSVINEALRSLPVQQHPRVLKLALQFGTKVGGPTSVQIWKRYVLAYPDQKETMAQSLIKMGYHGEAAVVLIELLNASGDNYALWTELVDLIGESDKLTLEPPVEQIISSGIKRFPDQRGPLTVQLANFLVRNGDLESARDVFEDGITTANTVRDFTVVFDAYAEFEERIVTHLIENESPMADLRIAKLDHLLERRPFLISDVRLRREPYSVLEWQKRIALYEDPAETVAAYTEAVQSIPPAKADGKLSQLWISWAKFYAEDRETACEIYHKATLVPYKSVSELADVYLAWSQYESENDHWENAVKIIKQALESPNTHVSYHNSDLTAQDRIHKSVRLWSYYADLVESYGTFEETKQVYEKIMALDLLTPLFVVNYATLLEENDHFEEMFKVYEKGISLFEESAFEIWNLYLVKASPRLGLERLRDLFEDAISKFPTQKALYILYGKLEEDRGLVRNAMRVYSAMCDHVKTSETFKYYIGRTVENFGLAATRPVYDKALESLPNRDASELALDYAQMEEKLGEIDRARAIYGYGSQFSDPQIIKYYDAWHKFEVAHGTEDTFKDMLRIKRSIQAQFNTDIHYATTAAEVKKGTVQEFVKGETVQKGNIEPPVAQANEDEIELDI